MASVFACGFLAENIDKRMSWYCPTLRQRIQYRLLMLIKDENT